GPEKVLQVEISLSVRQFSDFSATGEPRYKQTTEKRNFFFLSEREIAFLPLIVADGKEKDAFKLHEALLRVQAMLTGNAGAAAYGVVSVSSDSDGVEIYLDGGLVGRVVAGQVQVLHSVLVGGLE